jgi:hypothetical protein
MIKNSLKIVRMKDVGDDIMMEIVTIKDNVTVATIHLDRRYQVRTVLFFLNFTEKEELEKSQIRKAIKDLAVYHAITYVKNNIYFESKYLRLERQNNLLTLSESMKLFDFSRVPQNIIDCPEEEKDRLLKKRNVTFLEMAVTHYEAAFKNILEKAGLTEKVILTMKETTFRTSDPMMEIEASITPGEFTFWNYGSNPIDSKLDDRYHLHIVPHYHPRMNNTMKCIGGINGATDSYRQKTIDEIHCPHNEDTPVIKRGFGTWNYVPHPYKAVGTKFEMTVFYFKLLTQEGIDEIAEVLKAVSGDANTYIEVIGGFNPPFDSGDRVLKRLISKGHTEFQETLKNFRGSESSCMWEYNTLKEEGVLDKAYIPKWFTEKKWLEIYALDEKNNVAAG